MRTRTLEQVWQSPDLPYLAPALWRLDAIRSGPDERLHDYFAADAPVLVARAPGRLDVMGGIADYSGALVLQLPLECATTAMLQARSDPTIEIGTLRGGVMAWFTMPLAALLEDEPRSPDALAAWFDAHVADRWAAYVIGVAHACLVQRASTVSAASGGFRLLIESRVPEGKGVSSSAALEVACLSVIAARYDIELAGDEIARMAQWAENHIARAPCGIMDQMTSACGQRDRLLRLRCQPGTVEGHVAIPAGFRFYGIDSGIRHAVSGADYGTVRTAAFMGYRIIADLAGLSATRDESRVRIDDPRWRGYLANVTPAEFAARFEAALPERMSGAEFLERFGGTTDDVTQVRAEQTYDVRQATAHPVRENARVERFAELLAGIDVQGSDAAAREMGALMYESHESYGACGLGSDGTDRLVEMVREVGAERGLFGAKITGGGSGGTVAVFGTEGAEPRVRDIAARYSAESGRTAELFTRSGPGAAELGVVLALGTWG